MTLAHHVKKSRYDILMNKKFWVGSVLVELELLHSIPIIDHCHAQSIGVSYDTAKIQYIPQLILYKALSS